MGDPVDLGAKRFDIDNFKVRMRGHIETLARLQSTHNGAEHEVKLACYENDLIKLYGNFLEISDGINSYLNEKPSELVLPIECYTSANDVLADAASISREQRSPEVESFLNRTRQLNLHCMEAIPDTEEATKVQAVVEMNTTVDRILAELEEQLKALSPSSCDARSVGSSTFSLSPDSSSGSSWSSLSGVTRRPNTLLQPEEKQH